MATSSSIKTEIQQLEQEIQALENDLYDAEEAEETLLRMSKILRCETDAVESEVKRLVVMKQFMAEIGLPTSLSVSQMLAVRDAVRAALEA